MVWFFPRQKTHGAPRTPAKETDLQQDLGERASLSLHTPKDQHFTLQNEVAQTPKASSDYPHPPLGVSVCPAMSLLHGTATLGRGHNMCPSSSNQEKPLNVLHCCPGGCSRKMSQSYLAAKTWKRHWKCPGWQMRCPCWTGQGALQNLGAVKSSLTQKFPHKGLPCPALPSSCCRLKGALEGCWHPQAKPVTGHSWESLLLHTSL